ncbi:MAG TPA: diguanylate cyclase [Edaphobacter sp.]|uniref:diguanylate cyclase n=1 Tax=Edaphobacter sp. TaxID=1934404 RepID=UPI002C4DD867|nr:diguanylate cyclase [Edaphobacter sp.]HUZ95240.1 diguanylate cyclase [Edaphobacter sp.]
MQRFSQMVLSRWLLTASPVRTAMSTLAEREYERKRRLLGLVLVPSLLLIVLSTAFTSVSASPSQTFPGWIEVGVLLLALWLNRRGALQLASLLFFLPEAGNLLLAAQNFSLSHPVSVLWTLSPLALLLVLAGLFLPAWLILLMAIAANLLVGGYLLLVRSTQLDQLLSSQERWSFLTYLLGGMCASAMVGVFYTVTTRRAIIQADRAVELQQAHQALSAAYHGLEQAHATIQKQALTDALTGLPNHRAVMDQLSRELERARRYDRPFSLLFFDADRFKQVNDRYGHAAGDAVLHAIGERAGHALRGGDTLGRFGGEEFVLLLPEADASDAAAVAERLRAAIAAAPVVTAEGEEGIAMTVSIGLSTYPTDGPGETDVLSQADAAMYVAKRLGRNQVRTAAEARRMSADAQVLALWHETERREAVQREGVTAERLRESATLRLIYSLLALLERRDQGLSAHAHAVSELATALARQLGLGPQQVSRMGLAALVHDIGKVAVPDAILQQSQPLSAQERARLKEHAALGAQILEASPFLSDLMPAVRHHHERWDGSGYPDQLRGEDIPQAARIIAVAEAYDAMQRATPYRASRTAEEALSEVQRCAGTQFDPTVVQALLSVLGEQLGQQQPLQLIG